MFLWLYAYDYIISQFKYIANFSLYIFPCTYIKLHNSKFLTEEREFDETK